MLADGSWLVVEMGEGRGCVTRISPDGSEVRPLARTGRPNGLAIDRKESVWVAESHPTPALLRMDLAGQWELFATSSSDGTPFRFPNDLCFGPDGTLYMTDSGICLDDWAPGGQLKPDWKDLAIDGRVLRIDTATAQIDAIDAGLQFPNGIAFGVDDHLYVNEMIGGAVYRYRADASRSVDAREEFGFVNDPSLAEGYGPAGFRGPDGMTFGADGSLYVTVFGQQDVTVLDSTGKVVRRIRTEGIFPTNAAFGPPGSKRLYVTEGQFGTIEVFDIGTDGALLYG